MHVAQETPSFGELDYLQQQRYKNQTTSRMILAHYSRIPRAFLNGSTIVVFMFY